MTLLGGLTPAAFLRAHWQKKPLLVRQAIPGFAGIVSRDALFRLAMQEHVTSRLVVKHPRRWERHDGPFAALDASMLPAARWTLLVHGLESLVAGGWELLRAFSFIPAARVDDLMVSYAAPGGGVGPHDDKYDVFLLQGPGRRRWQIARGGERAVDERAAIKVLRSFVPEEEWVLEPGDMLYLPPGVAHHGVAEDACFTYSIGFLAPSHGELVRHFLGYLGETLPASIDADALLEDPELRPARAPLALGEAMIDDVAALVGRVRWDRARVADFLGRFLTMPRAHARFTPPARPISMEAFARRVRGRGRLTLALASRGLVRGGRLFFNGESHVASPPTIALFERLVGERALPLPLSLSVEDRALELLREWTAAGSVIVTR